LAREGFRSPVWYGASIFFMSELRLGDLIDDYCSRCRLLTNHSVVSIVDGEPAKVQCRTCHNEHNHRRGKAPAKKAATRKAQLFDAVLASIVGTPAEGEASAKGKK
jgi:hypothetical protein